VLKVFLWVNPITAPIMALKKLYDFAKSINLFETGKQIIEGLWKGLVSVAKKPIEVIKNIGHAIKEKFKSLLGISSPSKLFMEFGQFLNEGLGLGMIKSLGLVQKAIQKVSSVLSLPAKNKIKILPQIATEGLRTLTLPAALAVSLLSPVKAFTSPVKHIEKTYTLEKKEKFLHSEKLLKAEKVLKEKLITEKLVKERLFEKEKFLERERALEKVTSGVNIQVTINNLTVGKKEEAPLVAKEIARLTRAELERMLKEIEEQKARRAY
jgi:hypothetical protein